MISTSNTSVGTKSLGAMRHAIQKHLSQGVVRIPMMPQVASRIMTLINDPNVDLSDLSELIHRDASLAARVLQMANSVIYRGSETIGSLEAAINRMGIRTLSEIALSASLRAGVFRVPGYGEEVHRLWRHSLASGFFSKEIARLKRQPEEILFFCGLLHAIGKPAVLQIISDLNQQYHFQLQPEVLDALLDEFHVQIGTAVAEQWHLPKEVRATCAYYRDYAQAPDFQQEAAITYLADRLAQWMICSDQADHQSLKQDSVIAALSLGPEDVNQVLALRELVQAHVDAMDR